MSYLTSTKRWFKVCIVYSKPADGYRAFSLFLHLEEKFDQDYLFENELCQIESLAAPEAAQQALWEASEAEMIIVALESEAELTPDFKRWAEQLPENSSDDPRALVTLMAEQSDTTYLRDLAIRKGMDFISNADAGKYNSGVSPTGDWAMTVINDPTITSNRVEEFLGRQEHASFFPSGSNRWGINE